MARSNIELRVDAFIARWQGREGGQERANYGLFLSELCDAIGVERPDPASATTEENDYVFERAVVSHNPDGSTSKRRIDLYKRGSFVLEAKQSRQKGGSKEIEGQTDLFGSGDDRARGTRTASRAWDVLMLNARQQAEGYARALPVAHGWPPFILICDVGNVIEVWADFSGQGKNYSHFPDRQHFRIYLEELRDEKIRERLVAIWTDPMSLDPARETARVTREIAERLAAVSKSLERTKTYQTEDVAMFLMRCLFTMFAQSVELLPQKSFEKLLAKCEADPSKFQPMVSQLWDAMNTGDFAHAIEAQVKRFNGEFFKSHRALALGHQEIGELRTAAKCDWRDVDPSIFGALLEQALDPDERRKLGAHYTPRAYVERLVVATIIEPLRDEWNQVLSTAERQKSEKRADDAIATVAAFHEKLCATRILDPACGTGNFLYVSLELMKKLEGEVLDALANLGGQEALRLDEKHSVDPQQFLGLEINPRAAAIAELVLWIGHLQWHIRTKGGLPAEPILKAFHNIQVTDAVLTWDGWPAPKLVDGKETLPNANRPQWPQAEFIVGNPPFISNRRMREMYGDTYVETVTGLYEKFDQAADYVLFFWLQALLKKKHMPVRVGLVSTSRLRMQQNRAVFKNALDSDWKIIFAIPDHKWPSEADASVRVCFVTVSRGGEQPVLMFASDHDQVAGPVEFEEETYTILLVNSIGTDLAADFDVDGIVELKANGGLSHAGVKPYSRGLHIDAEKRANLFSSVSDAEKIAKVIFNGHDVGQRWRGLYVIDLFGYTEDKVRKNFPRLYQYLVEQVKPERSNERNPRLRREYWLFEANREHMREGLNGISSYIATLENSPQRYFVRLPTSVLPDQKLRVVVSDDACLFGVLLSMAHEVFSRRIGGKAGKANTPVYNTSCFTKFPFPDANELQKQRIGEIAEELDAHRKQVLEEHPKITLTGLYNVLEELRKGVQPDALDVKDRQIFDEGLVLILKEHHDRLDAAVAQAYGWPVDLSEADILVRLVDLNKERAREEARGEVHWLRPEYQIPRFGTAKEKAQLDLTGGEMREIAAAPGRKQNFPTNDIAQTAAVMAALAAASGPLDAGAIAVQFKQGGKSVKKIHAVLSALVRMGHVDSPGKGLFALALRRVA